MISLGFFCNSHSHSPFLSISIAHPTRKLLTRTGAVRTSVSRGRRGQRLVVRGCGGDGGKEEKKTETRRSFLTLEEAGLIEVSGLSTHERFLCRLTISSLNLLRVISEQEGCSIEELNAGRVCDWFLKDKLKREQNIESAVLQWDEPEFPM